MIKTTVYIEESTDRSLKQMAQSQGRSQAELIREALTTYAAQASVPRPKGIGAYSSGRSDVSERAEDLLREAAHEWRERRNSE